MTPSATVGVLLVNLGSPEAPTAPAVRRYLAEFLSDPLVVDWPAWIWKPVLHGIILRTRPARTAQAYARVWSEAGSPLVATTAAQAERVAGALGPGFDVRWAMRYGQPALAPTLEAMRDAGLERLVLVHLFPQPCEATTGSIQALLRQSLARMAWSPELVEVSDLATDARYVSALAQSIQEADAGFDCDRLLVSYHGLPARRGAAYAASCESTTAALLAALGWPAERVEHCYQSRFGPERWLGPATLDRAVALAPRTPKLLVVCPGFAADCLETLDEIGIELAHAFTAAGGEQLRLVPGLDLRPAWIDCLVQAVRAAAP